MDDEAVEALATEWMGVSQPVTWFSVSPRRLELQLSLIRDRVDDDITHEVLRIMPMWVRWLTERSAMPEPRAERVIAAASAPAPEGDAR